MKTIFKNPIDACRAIEARFEGKLPEPGKHIRLMHCDSRTGNRSVCLNVYADARGGYLYSFRDGISVEWRWSDADKQKYLKNNSDSLTLYKNKGLQNMKKYSSI